MAYEDAHPHGYTRARDPEPSPHRAAPPFTALELAM